MSQESSLKRAAELVAQARMVLVTAGAGMSVDSGLPDYRSKDGLWNRFPAYKKLRADYAALTRPSAFYRDPSFAWGFYGHCLQLYRVARPHAGYEHLQLMLERIGISYFVLTTNVDGQFLKAGYSGHRLRECHGTIHQFQCLAPCRRETWSADDETVIVDLETMRAMEPLPSCPFCGGLARPALFAFGDTQYVWEATQTQADNYLQWQTTVTHGHIVVIEVGSGTTVPGLRREGLRLANEHGGHLIRINLEEADVERPQDISIKLPAADALTSLSLNTL